MSDLLSTLQALEVSSRKPCPAVRVTSELEPEAGEYVLRLLKNPSVSVIKIHDALQKEGLSIARESLSKHRSGSCRCEDE